MPEAFDIESIKHGKKKSLEYDKEKVKKIVERMREKEKAAGLSGGDSKSVEKIRSTITAGRREITILSTKYKLSMSSSPLVRMLSTLAESHAGLFAPATKIVRKLPPARKLAFNLYAANMHYSETQYIELTAVGATLLSIILSSFAGLLLFITSKTLIPVILVPPIIGTVGFLFAAMLGLMQPAQKLSKQGKQIDKELPFALRHMSTEIKAGISLHRAMQAVAKAEYGDLSAEFSRTLREIDEGLSTEDALVNLSARTTSQSLKKTVQNILRAIRTGGNLSEIMSDIAHEVSDELKAKIVEFSEKMNFIGIVFIVFGIVLPVLVGVLAGIRNAPIGGSGNFFASLPLTIPIIIILYAFVFPMMLGMIVFLIKASEPSV